MMDEALSLHWTKSDIRVGFNSFEIFMLVCKFEILNLDASMSLFVFVSSSFSVMEPHSPPVFLVGCQ